MCEEVGKVKKRASVLETKRGGGDGNKRLSAEEWVVKGFEKEICEGGVYL